MYAILIRGGGDSGSYSGGGSGGSGSNSRGGSGRLAAAIAAAEHALARRL